MKRLATISLSVIGLAAVVLVGAQFFHVEKTQLFAAVSDWQQGASIMPKSKDDFASDTFKQSVRDLHDTGANSVSLIYPVYQSNLKSSDIAAGWNTPSDQSLASAIQYIHSLGMQVMIKPHLESYTGEWRALINATDRATWYKNYGAMLNHIGDIGKQNNVESICIGTELISMSAYTENAGNTAAWLNMINDLKTHYSGALTYSANWGGPGFPDEKAHIGFWPQLDYIGISAYFSLYVHNPNYDELSHAWTIYRRDQIEPLYNQYHKPILFTEIGYRSVPDAHNAPWNYSLQGAADQQEQANDYETLFKYWNDYSYIAGVQLWQWDSNPNAGGQNNTDYTPQNKLAEDVMKKWWGAPTTPTTNPGQNPPPVVDGKWNATASAQGAVVNQSVSIPVSVTAPALVNDAIVDVEIYNPSGSQIYQKYFDHQSLNTTATTLSVPWTPSQTGNYIVKVGVFSNDWSQNYYWTNNAVTFAVAQTGSTGGNTGGSTGGTTGGNTGGSTGGTTGGTTNSKVPAVNTLQAQVNGTSATISGTVNMNGGKGTAWFEYSDKAGTWPYKAGVRGVSGSNTNTLTVVLTGLKAKTTYYYRIMAENYDGTYVKKIAQTLSFTTQ